MSTYYIRQGLGEPPLAIEIDGVPPCLYCDAPVGLPSMDGPLVCANCDCGRNPDGSRWTPEQAMMRNRHLANRVEEFRRAAIAKGSNR